MTKFTAEINQFPDLQPGRPFIQGVSMATHHDRQQERKLLTRSVFTSAPFTRWLSNVLHPNSKNQLQIVLPVFVCGLTTLPIVSSISDSACDLVRVLCLAVVHVVGGRR